jgi:hypothetical protein
MTDINFYFKEMLWRQTCCQLMNTVQFGSEGTMLLCVSGDFRPDFMAILKYIPVAASVNSGAATVLQIRHHG